MSKLDDIRNNIARECLRYLAIEEGVAINHDGDLPASSGVGSSSAFTVGMLNALHCLRGEMESKPSLANEAIHVEQDLIKDKVGNQDQIACSYGGFNRIDFHKTGDYKVSPVNITPERKRELERHLLMVFTGFPRTASDIAGTYDFKQNLSLLMDMVKEGEHILTSGSDIKAFGSLLNLGWQMKKHLSSAISTPYIDFLYDSAIKAGAIGGKVLGAGGGGFMLLFCEPDKQDAVKKALNGLLLVPFKFESKGSQVVLNNGNS